MPDKAPLDDDDGPAIIRRVAASDAPVGACTLSDTELLAEIGRALRATYSELLREPIPEHLAVIIQKLDTHRPDRP